MGRKIKSKNSVRKRKQRVKNALDPRDVKENLKERNKPPKGDPDCVDDLLDSGAAGGNALLAGLDELPAPRIPEEERQSNQEAASEGAAKRKRKKKQQRRGRGGAGGGAGGSDDEEDGPGPGKGKGRGNQEAASSQTLRRRKGESEKAFNRRVRKHEKEQKLRARRKLISEHQREKRRQRDDKKKAKLKEKRADVHDGLFRQPERHTFGDVVKRPPELSSSVLKSRDKLKAKAAQASGSTPGPLVKFPGKIGGTGASAAAAAPGATGGGKRKGAGMEEYASKVREAYAALKKRRLAGVGQ